MNDDRVFLKCAWRLNPFMMLLYFVNFVDRVDVGFAALTMNRDLGFSPAVYGFGADIFFLGYFLFQVPVNVILERVGARRGVDGAGTGAKPAKIGFADMTAIILTAQRLKLGRYEALRRAATGERP